MQVRRLYEVHVDQNRWLAGPRLPRSEAASWCAVPPTRPLFLSNARACVCHFCIHTPQSSSESSRGWTVDITETVTAASQRRPAACRPHHLCIPRHMPARRGQLATLREGSAVKRIYCALTKEFYAPSAANPPAGGTGLKRDFGASSRSGPCKDTRPHPIRSRKLDVGEHLWRKEEEEEDLRPRPCRLLLVAADGRPTRSRPTTGIRPARRRRNRPGPRPRPLLSGRCNTFPSAR